MILFRGLIGLRLFTPASKEAFSNSKSLFFLFEMGHATYLICITLLYGAKVRKTERFMKTDRIERVSRVRERPMPLR